DWVGGNNGGYHTALLGVNGINGGDPDTAAGFGSLAGAFANSYVGDINPNLSFATNVPQKGSFSVECWVLAGAQSADAGIVTKGFNGSEQFSLDCGANNPLHAFRWNVRDTNGTAHPVNSSFVPDNIWHHLVGVCEETNGVVRLYVDARQIGTAVITNG